MNCNSLYEGDRDERNKMRGPEDKQKRQLFGWYTIYDTLRGICMYYTHILYIGTHTLTMRAHCTGTPFTTRCAAFVGSCKSRRYFAKVRVIVA